MLENIDRKIIESLKESLPLESKPFKTLAESIGIREEEFITRLRRMKEEGIIRRFGARVTHHRAGIKANAMVAWKVPEEKIEETGRLFASFEEVSHCYLRPAIPDFPYNLYTMLHCKTVEEIKALVKKLSTSSGIKNYVKLDTEKEYKKSTPVFLV